MVRASNGIIACLNILTLILACGAMGLSLWFQVSNETPCQRTLKTPLLIIGASLFAVSLAGLVGSCCRVSLLLWVYLLVLFLLILGLMAFTVFAFIVTNRAVGEALSGKGVGGHRLGDYSKWLQRTVIDDGENWEEIKSCLVDVRLCRSIEGGKGEEYYKHELSPIKSGCCKPPNYCGFGFKNATFWTMPEAGPAMPDLDCKRWSNNQRQLCLDCESCKRAVLHGIKMEWRMLSLINVSIVLFVIVVYSVGCCALRNNRSAKNRSGHA